MFVVFNGLITNKNGYEIFNGHPTSKRTLICFSNRDFLLGFMLIFLTILAHKCWAVSVK